MQADVINDARDHIEEVRDVQLETVIELLEFMTDANWRTLSHAASVVLERSRMNLAAALERLPGRVTPS